MKKTISFLIIFLIVLSMCACDKTGSVKENTLLPSATDNTQNSEMNKSYKVPKSMALYNSNNEMIEKDIWEWNFDNNTYTQVRLESEQTDQVTYSFSCNTNGMITEIKNEDKTKTFSYDQNNKLIKYGDTEVIYSNNYKTAKNGQKIYSFDPNGNVIKMESDNGNFICEATYDDYNNLITYTENGQLRIDKSKRKYDDKNNIIEIILDGKTDAEIDTIKYKYENNYPVEILDLYYNQKLLIEYTDVTEIQYNALRELRFSDFNFPYTIHQMTTEFLYDFYKPI